MLHPPHNARTDTDGLTSSHGEEAARIAMSDESVLALLRQHFTGSEWTWLCPAITGTKELVARAVHARHLPGDERILMLYDDTVLGSGDIGFLVTSRRICWKNATDRPHMLEWHQVDPDRMYADRQRLVLGTRAIEITGDESIMDACERAFHVLALSARAPSATAGSGISVAQARSSSMDPNAASPTGRPMSKPMPQHPLSHPTVRPSHAAALEPSSETSVGRAVTNATPPPPHSVSYDSYVVHASSQRGPAFACWCCDTPLYRTTPQCARCSALPTRAGWRPTA
jgi:hypothetical protein